MIVLVYPVLDLSLRGLVDTGQIAYDILFHRGACEADVRFCFHWTSLHRHSRIVTMAEQDTEGEREPRVEELLRFAIEAINCNYAIFDQDRYLVDCSSSYVELHRPTFDTYPAPLRYDTLMREAIARSLPDLAPDEASNELARRVAAHISDSPGEFDRLYPDGRWMRVTKRLLPAGYVAGVAVDISLLKRREAEIAASEARYRALVDTAQVGIWHLDESGKTLFTNDRLRLMCGGAEPAELSGAMLSRQSAAVSAGPFGFPPGHEVEAVLLANAGQPTANVLVCASDWLPISGQATRGVVLTLLDITALKTAQAKAEHLAWHDALTGLHNRAMFQSIMDGLAAQAEPVVLLFLDLDGFKLVNDRHGHGAGDRLLQEVAQRLRSVVPPGDAVFRLGGDEFAVVLRGAGSMARTDSLAERLIEAVGRPIWAGDLQLGVTASLGHACFPNDADDAEALQRAADLALYAAKRSGRARALPFDGSLRSQAERRQLLSEALVTVVSEGKLSLAWQPQYTLPGNVLRGAEALVRWPCSPLGGEELGPGAFFEHAEEAGLMPALDHWVLEAALDQSRRWAGCPGRPDIVSINVTAATLRDPSFPARVAAALVRHNVPSSSLEIEIPESLATRDLEAVAPILEQLCDMRVRLALDDFGGGMSSVSHLVRLPYQLVKLDRSIVAGLPNPRERAVLSAVVAVAKSLSIPVLAEGVETESQAFMLRREGVQLVQGFLYGKPQPPDQLVSSTPRQGSEVRAGRL